ncbi:hypothetical protein RJ640_012638 [Escallonia rubra]|uniref:Uncharacterized protein n=1 Tax=Escallonia rubra TaxID=112253 RepID=A0AA88RPV9_9ASTE|nr:hypothetical protein RJ640_012638 [Escallonia rubra]
MVVLQAGKQHISSSAWVKWVNHLAKWSSGNTVVESALAEDLGSNLEPHRLTELDAVVGQKLREDTPESSEHCPPGMDHLKLAVLGKSFWVIRKPSSVPAVVTKEFTGEIGWSLIGEWSQISKFLYLNLAKLAKFGLFYNTEIKNRQSAAESPMAPLEKSPAKGKEAA